MLVLVDVGTGVRALVGQAAWVDGLVAIPGVVPEELLGVARVLLLLDDVDAPVLLVDAEIGERAPSHRDVLPHGLRHQRFPQERRIPGGVVQPEGVLTVDLLAGDELIHLDPERLLQRVVAPEGELAAHAHAHVQIDHTVHLQIGGDVDAQRLVVEELLQPIRLGEGQLEGPKQALIE